MADSVDIDKFDKYELVEGIGFSLCFLFYFLFIFYIYSSAF